ncbi:MAG TPA: hypothetical protein PKC19_21620, partial [Roseiflexaceae bacterium]|nr:hypothetical protein [Roseiflexaceae bacterium]
MKPATATPFAYRTVELDGRAKHRLKHPPIHGTQCGMLLSNVVIWACKRLDFTARFLNLNRNTARFDHGTQRFEPLGEI